MNRLASILLVFAILLTFTITGCVSSPPVNTEATAQAAIVATLTAQPTPTKTYTPSPTPTATATASNTSTPISTATSTTTPTNTSTSTATNTPTPTNTATSTTTPTSTPIPPTPTPKPNLVVEFNSPYYQCTRSFNAGYYSLDERFSGTRNFQIDFSITNNSDETIQPIWRPTRWIITDGANERTDEKAWQWGEKEAVKMQEGWNTVTVGHLEVFIPAEPHDWTRLRPYQQPVIVPGDKQAWTWLAFPLQEGEFVSSVEFEYNGTIYSHSFDYGVGKDNYVSCP